MLFRSSKLRLSLAYHPMKDGQTERTIQSLEDLLRACVLEQGGSWDTYLSLIYFTYNNSYHSSIGMAPFKALYGQRCRTHLCWHESGESVVLGPAKVPRARHRAVNFQTVYYKSQNKSLLLCNKRNGYEVLRRPVVQSTVGSRVDPVVDI